MSISAATLRELYRLGLSDVLDKRVESLEARINFINDKIIIRQKSHARLRACGPDALMICP